MAYYLKSNGDAQPVFAIDVRNGPVAPGASTAGTPVNAAGPKLDFFRLVASGTLAAEQGVNGYVSAILQAVQQTSTIATYQVDGVAVSFAVFPAGAFVNAAAFLAAAQTAVHASITLDSATQAGFKLAT